MHSLRPGLLGLLALSASPLWGALVLQCPTTPVPAGEEFTVELIETNPGTEPARPAAGAAVPAVAFVPGQAPFSTVLAVVHAPDHAPIPAGGFRATQLRGRLPDTVSGLVILDATAVGAGRIALDIAPLSANSGSIAEDTASVGSRVGPSAAPTPTPPRHELGLSPHEPIYFSIGGEGGLNARFQFSFKFRPIGPSDDHIAGAGFWEDIYAAYTQTSLWDLHSLSKPFTDSSYRPALFYHRYDSGLGFLGGRLGFAGGFEHESNGKSGADSRSINIAFARPTLRWGADNDWQLTLSPKFYTYLEKSENADITRFRGYGDFLVALEHPRSLKVAALFRIGTSGHGSVLVDASYPFSKVNEFFPLGLVHGYLHFQFFDGWGESLLHYNERTETQFRVGFMAVR